MAAVATAASPRPTPAAARQTVPTAPPPTAAQVATLVGLLERSRRLLVLTGAGMSTESGIPDYRSPHGAYSTGFAPMTHQAFMGSDAARRRYWARSFAGWPAFAAARPNAGHHALAVLLARGWAAGLVTQNVDRLHHAAMAPSQTQSLPPSLPESVPESLVELHGTTHVVLCMSCRHTIARVEWQAALAAANPAAAARLAGDSRITDSSPGQITDSSPEAFAADLGVQRPDGDVELELAGSQFVIPLCPACGSTVLKPDVVFFGDSVPPATAAAAAAMAASADGVLVVGTSLHTQSALRLVRAASEAGARSVILAVGPTRGDGLRGVTKLECRAGETLSAALGVACHLRLPRLAGPSG